MIHLRYLIKDSQITEYLVCGRTSTNKFIHAKNLQDKLHPLVGSHCIPYLSLTLDHS